VFYVTEDQLQATATSLGEAGFGLVGHENPYWANAGALVYRDPDGYLVVPSLPATDPRGGALALPPPIDERGCRSSALAPSVRRRGFCPAAFFAAATLAVPERTL
jgi:hypothetical protein